jgi:hypothetical protein
LQFVDLAKPFVGLWNRRSTQASFKSSRCSAASRSRLSPNQRRSQFQSHWLRRHPSRGK